MDTLSHKPELQVIEQIRQEVIDRLKKFGPIEELEKRMRPRKTVSGPEVSASGFLGQYESLVEICLRDELKVRELGLTHEQIAAPLFDIVGLSSVALTDYHQRAKRYQARKSYFEESEEYQLVLRRNSIRSVLGLEPLPLPEFPEAFPEGVYLIKKINGRTYFIDVWWYKDNRQIDPLIMDGHNSANAFVFDITDYHLQSDVIDDFREEFLRLYSNKPGHSRFSPHALFHGLERVNIPFVLPFIVREGFYEGESSEFRISPERLAEFFHITSDKYLH